MNRNTASRSLSATLHIVWITTLLCAPAIAEPGLRPAWSSFLGGDGDDWIRAVSVDVVADQEVITVAGVTSAGVLPFLGEEVGSGDTDIFVARISGDGRELLWLTHVGGPGVDGASALTVDQEGNSHVVGWGDVGFPTTNGAFSEHAGGLDAILLRLDREGEVQYATCIGGGLEDVASSCVVDNRGRVTIVGNTKDPAFPVTAGALQATHAGGRHDAFILRLNPDPLLSPTEQLEYASFLGGSADEAPAARWVDRTFPKSVTLFGADAVAITGNTTSHDFPTTGHGAERGLAGSADVHVTVVRCDTELSAEEQLTFSILIGGSGWEWSNALLASPDGSLLVGGATSSSDFATTDDAYQRLRAGGGDAFLVRLRPAGGQGGEPLEYATLLGGEGNDVIQGMGLVGPKRLALAGYTSSTSFPAPSGFLRGLGAFDAFVTVMDLEEHGAEQLLCSKLVGGSSHDQADSLAVSPAGGILVGGLTVSGDFPVSPGAFDSSKGGVAEGVLLRFQPDEPAPPVVFLRGDCNGDGSVDISDAVCVLNWLFLGGATPGCVAVTNTNGDAGTDISDATFLLNHLFLGGPAPAAPFSECGPATLPTDDCETPPNHCQQERG